MNRPYKRKKAVALKYLEGNDTAPKVSASGRGVIADNILEKARANDIPVHEDETLVELLSELEINERIPDELYRAVAEVFAFIYNVDKDIQN
ncbi:EscU/YscU/HrcU family type III secretion system export apparatus switch protein [Sediminibacillus massiliensis]|uniref:EscU/YscU/HrcU family type III secretion system export apparatus switch protein n=1 Tax=Sediminibacillus massiliensis TaxID=1926277 RepID=UPI00098845C7|nr:EscU/YscU/HrcU family type III secretion system export apparatus switch protein [Sediminibacillus massiliensis]